MPENEQTCEDSRRRASVNGSADRIKAYVAIARVCLNKIIVSNNADMIRRRELEMCFSQIDESADKIRATNPPNSVLGDTPAKPKSTNP